MNNFPNLSNVPNDLQEWANKNIKIKKERIHWPIVLVLEGPSRIRKT